jgi:hypothetical protein
VPLLTPGMTRYSFYGREGGPLAGMDGCNFAFSGIRSPDRPARGESIYRQRYAGVNGSTE